MARMNRQRAGVATAAVLAVAGFACFGMSATAAFAGPAPDNSANTTTPIKHVVVIFPENESFDHYFGTYPNSANTDGTTFAAAAGTPVPNNYVTNPAVLTNNPNSFAPMRLSHEQAWTCSQNHGYNAEQLAINSGAMNLFPEKTQASSTCSGATTEANFPGDVMGYYDGNTVTAEWNLAQNYALSDNSWDATFGPSTPGALNLISGQTHGATGVDSVTGATVVGSSAVEAPDANGVGTVINDPDPAFDDCSDNNHTSTSNVAKLEGKNVGDLLNTRGVSWGWFQGGFAPTKAYAGAGTYAVCGATQKNIGGVAVNSYSPHHSPFEYYESTSNPHHLPATSVAAIGHDDQANHNYDMTDFDAALAANNLPAVSFLKPAAAQDAHPGNSDPIDEQAFLVKEINSLEKSPEWSSTAIVISYDDSDGWYDHVAPTILNGSTDSKNDTALCAIGTPAASGGYEDRCGPSQRLPMLVVSPFAKQNYIDHTLTTQPSVLKFIEDNWATGRVGDSSFDATAGDITGMFDFAHPQTHSIVLADDGSVVTAAAPVASPVAAPADPALANTGTNPTGPILAGVFLLGAGVVLMVVRRRQQASKR